MKKVLSIILLVFLLCFVYYCRKKAQVERFVEDGVEVVINHVEPYKIKGEPSALHLEEEFTIDTERDEIAGVGLTDIYRGFDVDSEGNIYFINLRGLENLVYKFDRNGSFMKSFAGKGQGPGEFQRPNIPVITNRDDIVITDSLLHKLSTFSKDGRLVEETQLESYTQIVLPLEDGKYLVGKLSGKTEQKFSLILCSDEFEEIKELDSTEIPNPFKGSGIKGIFPVIIASVSGNNIYVGNDKRGYEIWIFDLEGDLIRKIRKEYKPVEVNEKYRKRFLKMYESPQLEVYRKRVYFPEHFPPFQYFFTNDEGKLFVMTYEKGESPQEYKYDIIDTDGIFIGRTSLGNIHKGDYYNEPLLVKAKKNRLYCLIEKENGYKQLVVYKMRWE